MLITLIINLLNSGDMIYTIRLRIDGFGQRLEVKLDWDSAPSIRQGNRFVQRVNGFVLNRLMAK